MLKLSPKRFIELYTARFPKDKAFQKNAKQVEELVTWMVNDKKMLDLRYVSYALATIKHETAGTYLPIEEYGKGKKLKYGKPGTNGKIFYGRGYVQLTWEENYKKFGKLLMVDLFNKPELACDPHIAYEILSLGMTKGLFTGRGFDDYISDSNCDYYNCRRIINGLDKADLIAMYAFDFEKTLRDCHEPVI